MLGREHRLRADRPPDHPHRLPAHRDRRDELERTQPRRRHAGAPGRRTKNGKPFLVPLDPEAVRILVETPKRAGRELVFGTGARGFQDGRKCKERLDARLEKALGRKVEPWRVHDLRRTTSTGSRPWVFRRCSRARAAIMRSRSSKASMTSRARGGETPCSSVGLDRRGGTRVGKIPSNGDRTMRDGREWGPPRGGQGEIGSGLGWVVTLPLRVETVGGRCVYDDTLPDRCRCASELLPFCKAPG